MKNNILIAGLAIAHCLSVSVTLYADDCSKVLKEAEQKTSLLEKREVFDKAMPACANNAEVNYHYAYCLERLRKYQEATTYYEKAISLNGSNAKYYLGLADTLKNINQPYKAIEAYQKGLAIDPSNKRAANEMEELIKTTPPKKEEKQPPPPPKIEVETEKAKPVEKPLENITLKIVSPNDYQICKPDIDVIISNEFKAKDQKYFNK